MMLYTEKLLCIAKKKVNIFKSSNHLRQLTRCVIKTCQMTQIIYLHKKTLASKRACLKKQMREKSFFVLFPSGQSCIVPLSLSPFTGCPRLMLVRLNSSRPSQPCENRYSTYQLHGLTCCKTHATPVTSLPMITYTLANLFTDEPSYLYGAEIQFFSFWPTLIMKGERER